MPEERHRTASVVDLRSRLGFRGSAKCPHEGPSLLLRFRPAPPALPQSRDELAVVYGKAAKRRLSEIRRIEKSRYLSEQARMTVHAEKGNGKSPIGQWGISFSPFPSGIGTILRMQEDLFRRRLRERVDAKFDGDMRKASRAANLGETFVRDVLERGKGQVGIAKLTQLAAALDCSVAYLIGETDHLNPDMIAYTFPEQVAEFVDALRSMAPGDRARALKILQTFAESDDRTSKAG